MSLAAAALLITLGGQTPGELPSCARVHRDRPPNEALRGSLTATVVERSEGGTILRRWSTPAEAQPLAVRGHELVIRYRNSHFGVRDMQGSIRPAVLREPPAAQGSCAVAPGVEGAHATCEVWRDLLSGRPRHISFERVCR